MQRSKNRVVAQDTLSILEQGYYLNSKGEQVDVKEQQTAAEKGTELWLPTSLDEIVETENWIKKEETIFSVSNDTTFNAVRLLFSQYPNQKIACLNFASAKNPGGGFLNGSQAQEESLARSSGLYNCLLTCPEYYTTHRSMRSCIYTDTMIYAPSVPIFKYENGELMDVPVLASILTSPAVNAGVVRRQERKKVSEIIPAMHARIDKALALFAEKGAEILVLGAWGCGVFQNEPKDIAELFKEIITQKYLGVFKYIEFAIYSKNSDKFIKPFEDIFLL